MEKCLPDFEKITASPLSLSKSFISLFSFIPVLFLLSFFSPLLAQKTIAGIIIDKESGEALPAANIQIEGTYRGTITNVAGEYILELTALPAMVTVSYIGYESQKSLITSDSPEWLEISLTPVVYELEAITVTDEDPAVSIMRKVIAKKQEWRKKLETYQAEAYSRMMLENDSGIVSIQESVSEAFWHHKDGPREVIKSRRQTENVEAENNFAAASYIANFYDDDVEIQGFRMVGPTHPDAIKHYHFKLEDRRFRDEKVVYDISLRPKSKLQSAFVGRIAVLDEDYAMIEVDLKPSENLLYPPPIQEWDVAYQQQFNNFGKDFWLPVDVRLSGYIKFGLPGLNFPRMGYRQISRITNYQINIDLPDSLYQKEAIFSVDSTAIQEDFATKEADIIPFSEEENAAYEAIDSTDTFGKAFQPTGFLARFVDMDEEDGEGKNNGEAGFFSKHFSFSPQLSYNRVDEGLFGLDIGIRTHRPIDFSGGFAYLRGLKRWSYNGSTDFTFGNRGNSEISLSYKTGLNTRYHSDTYSALTNSASILLGYDDYYDYYWQKSFQAAFSKYISELNSDVSLTLHSEDHRSVTKNTDYSLLRKDFIQRENPAIPEGVLRSLRFNLEYGESFTPFGLIGGNGFSLEVEHSDPDIISSDFSFTRFHLSADFRINTFFRRRMLPNALDVRFVAGAARGDLPMQRFGILESGVRALKPFGTFRTLVRTPYEGEKYLGVFWEHNFRTVPFEILGLRSLAKKGMGIILHGASGRTWFEDGTLQKLNYAPRFTNDFHHEIGLSVNQLFGLFRLDFAQRLDQKGFYVGFGIARLF